MAHQVETMAYTNELPWHGLGVNTKGKSVDQWVKAAGLDWRVAKHPMFWATQEFVEQVLKRGEAKTTIPAARLVADNFALVRDLDSKVLDVVGPDYQPRQNLRRSSRAPSSPPLTSFIRSCPMSRRRHGVNTSTTSTSARRVQLRRSSRRTPMRRALIRAPAGVSSTPSRIGRITWRRARRTGA